MKKKNKEILEFAVTGTFHGSIVYALTEGQARKLFHEYYNGESIINVKKLNKK